MPTQQNVGSAQTTAQPVNQNAVHTRLPKLYLPKFRGDVTKWNTVWDSFQSVVHRNEGISNINKFNYLNSVLQGATARAIQGLTLTEANYDAAVKLLQECFEAKAGNLNHLAVNQSFEIKHQPRIHSSLSKVGASK